MSSHNSTFKEIETINGITLEVSCPFCHKKQQLVFEGDRAIAYNQGVIAQESGIHIQDAFTSFTPDEREFMMTGICPKCWDNM